ncbi:MAG: 30S ribosomal protein S8 [Chlamydiae bacterium]|nr:30S ribosomal protein S8 [Chlamydiota bacterium]
MSFNDPIAELLTKLRNAISAKHRYVDIQVSKMKMNIIQIMKEQGFIENFLVNDKKRMVRVFLKYSKTRQAVVRNLTRMSTPGMRKYVGYREIPRYLGGVGTVILSTPAGVIDGNAAKEKKVGGELLCYIY